MGNVQKEHEIYYGLIDGLVERVMKSVEEGKVKKFSFSADHGLIEAEFRDLIEKKVIDDSEKSGHVETEEEFNSEPAAIAWDAWVEAIRRKDPDANKFCVCDLIVALIRERCFDAEDFILEVECVLKDVKHELDV